MELLGVVGPLILKEDTTMKTLKTSKGVWELCKLPIGVRDEARPHMHFGVFRARKSHLAATFFYKRLKKKSSCIDIKCRNDVQKFTPTKISGGAGI